MIPTRRLVLAGAGALVAGGAARPSSRGQTHKAQTWIDYEARLRARLDDAGGGRFDAVAERELLALSNAARAKAGAGALVWNHELAQTARAQAGDLAGRTYFEHLSPEGFDPTDRLGLIARSLLATTSENIAFHNGEKTASGAYLFDLWRKSPPHWSNLRSARHSEAGFGVARIGSRAYAVGLYAFPEGQLAAPIPFRLQISHEIRRALGPTADGYLGYWLEDQTGPGRRPLVQPVQDGVWRLRLDRQLTADDYVSLFGPIVAFSA